MDFDSAWSILVWFVVILILGALGLGFLVGKLL
jgi:hypothetical protein